jgi:hypothetical protein
MKAINDGTCQWCGARQRLNPRDNTMVNHGYNVTWGFFNGICRGADHAPFEVSKDLIDTAINNVEAQIVALDGQIAKYTDPTSEVNTGNVAMFNVYYGRNDKYATTPYRWVQCAIREVTKVYSDGTGSYQQFFRVRNDDEGPQRGFEQSLNGDSRTMAGRVLAANRYYVQCVLEPSRQQAVNYVAWQRNRIATWEAKPLLARAKGR